MAGKAVLLQLLLMIVLASLESSNGAKILMIILNHKSHVYIFGNLGRALVDDGHQVWLLTSDKYTGLVESYKLVPLTLNVPKDADLGERFRKEMLKNRGKIKLDVWPEPGRYCEEVLGNKDIMKTIPEQDFDLAIMGNSVAFTCMYAIPYKFDIPYISVFVMQTTSWSAGVTGMPSIEPEVMTPFTNKMDFWQRLTNFKAWLNAMNTPLMVSFDKYILQRYAPEKPHKTFYDILKDSKMFLLNYDVFCLDYPRVSAPNYQYLGPASIADIKPLPEDIKSFVDGAKHGVVILTFGSFDGIQLIWSILREKVFTALGRLKQRAVIQYGLEDDGGNVPNNVLLLDYLPQNDLLTHSKTKLFITHGGNSGQNEAVYYGVPMLVIPIATDEPFACARAVERGYGKCVKDKEAITSDELYNMMQDVLSNASYSNNVKKCSRILHSMPTAKERIVFWVNHILEFGGDHLRPPSLDMPLYQVLMLDIAAYYVMIAMFICYGGVALVYIFYQRILKGRKDKAE